jgi:multidrug efflux pump subunit AcrA (membrane-fusion protein)
MTGADQSREEDRRGGLVRRVLSPGPNPEERLEELLANRRRELDEHARRLHESIAELERREELLRDSRTSVERVLRIGTSDLEAREAELTSYLRDLTDRETRLSEAEEDLARRRQDLGAVELKRATVERRERAVEAHEAELEEREARASLAGATTLSEVEVQLAFVPGATYRLVELEPVPLSIGLELEVSDETFVVARIGTSPLPGDPRRCAYLVRGVRGRDAGLSGSS